MKKTRLALICSILFLFFCNNQAEAVPDIRGEYSGSYTIVVSACEEAGTYYADLEMSIPTQSGSTFSGSAEGTMSLDGDTATEYIQLSGTITESGQISGTTTHTFLGTGGTGTFTGQLTGDTLSISNTGHDTYGSDCGYVRTMTATREVVIEPDPPSANFSVSTTSGYIPLIVNFTDESSGNITSWNWNFGDGATSTIQNPSHTYATEGTYSVSLSVSGPDGSDTESKNDFITATSVPDKNKILPSDGEANDSFGISVSISGNYAIVGTPKDDDKGYYSGAAYVFEKTDDSWIQVAKLTANDEASSDGFGWGVSISGNYAIVGSRWDDDNGENSGSAYIYERIDGIWTQTEKLTASDGAADDDFGFSVSISGNNAIVGAQSDDDNGENSGSAYIFERSDGTWPQTAKLTASDGGIRNSFGIGVSISDNYAIVGAYLDDDNGFNSGSAYIFERNDDVWTQVKKLIPSDGAAYDYFGYGVSISGDNAVVGAYGDDGNEENSGSAYIFERINSTWTLVSKLSVNDQTADSYFGTNVSISGNFIILGAYGDDDNGDYSGSAYLFERIGDTWTQVDKITPSDGAAHDNFGYRVSVSGNYAIVSAIHDNDNGYDSGSAYIYQIYDPFEKDLDNDGLLGGEEDVNQNGQVDEGETDPNDPDTDDDGMPDGWEVTNGLNPLLNDASKDSDLDGFNNIIEYNRGTDPQDSSSHPSKSMPWMPLFLED